MNAPTHKMCSNCATLKVLDKFAPHVGGKFGRRAQCRACHGKVVRAWRKTPSGKRSDRLTHVKTKYGLSGATYEALERNQEGKCAICLSPFSKHQPHVDHDHRTSKVRGLLCGTCNKGLGQFKDDPALLQAAAVYVNYRGN